MTNEETDRVPEGRNSVPTFEGDLPRRMKVAAEIGGYDRFVSLSGRSAKQIGRYLKGSEVPFGVLQVLTDHSGVSMEWLAAGNLTKPRDADAQLKLLEEEHSRYSEEVAPSADREEMLQLIVRQKAVIQSWRDRTMRRENADTTGISGHTPLPRTPDFNLVGAVDLEAVRHSMPLDLPVFGTAAGSLIVRPEGAFEMENRVVEYVRRPPALSAVRDAYAFYVEGESMSPEHRPGDLRFVHPYKHPRQGDSVVVQAQYAETSGIEAILAHFVSRNAETVIVSKLRPAETQIEFRAQFVRHVHKVLSLAELFGV